MFCLQSAIISRRLPCARWVRQWDTLPPWVSTGERGSCNPLLLTRMQLKVLLREVLEHLHVVYNRSGTQAADPLHSPQPSKTAEAFSLAHSQVQCIPPRSRLAESLYRRWHLLKHAAQVRHLAETGRRSPDELLTAVHQERQQCQRDRDCISRLTSRFMSFILGLAL